MSNAAAYLRYGQDNGEAGPSQRRQRPRLGVVGMGNDRTESGDADLDFSPRYRQHFPDSPESQSEVDHGEEAVDFEVSEDDLTHLFSRPQPSDDGSRSSEERREGSDAGSEDSHAWDVVKSLYKSQTYNILPSHYSISEEGKLGKVPVPALITAGTRKSDSHRSSGVFKWLHLENSNMSFEAFRAFAMQAEGLDSSDREQLKRLLIEVYSTYDSGSKDNRYMKPGVEASCIVRADSPPSSKSLAWSCVPFLRLAKYNLTAGLGDLSQHSPWGLLQWHYNDFSNRRNLDLEQTVRKFTEGSNEIIQIDQLWCITINQGLIITSARCSAETLVGSNSNLQSEDLETATSQSGKFNRGFLVHDLGNRVWAFNAEGCRTWLEFVAQFKTITEFFDDEYAVFEDKTLIRPQDWVEIHNRAMSSLVRLTVVQIIEDHAGQHRTKKSASDRRTDDFGRSYTEEESSFAEFRVFPWLWASHSESDLVPSLDLSSHIDKMVDSHPSLLAHVRGDKSVQRSDGTSLQYAEELVKKLQADVNSPQSKGQVDFKARKSFVELKVSTWSSACKIAGFFLPSTDNSLLSNRYWTLINTVLEADYDDCTIDLENLVTHLQRLSKTMIKLQKLLHPSLTPAPHDLELPAELGLAWVLVLKALTTAGKLHYSSYQVADTFRQCGRLLKYARRKILQSLATQDLADAEVVLPLSLSGLVMNTLVQDVDVDALNDLVSTYSQYSDNLELDILKSRGDREYHAQFTRVSHELSVMRDIAASQIKVLQDLQKVSGTEDGGFAANSMGINGPETGLENRLLHRARRTAQARHKQYITLMKEFEDLKTENERMVKMTKDNRETASVIFAIVSTIFLPLTAVASVLGMNTTDIRDMQQSQWVFWITGVPLAVITGFLCVIAVDKHLISTSFSWLGDFFPLDKRLRRRLARHDDNAVLEKEKTPAAPLMLVKPVARARDVDVELGQPRVPPENTAVASETLQLRR